MIFGNLSGLVNGTEQVVFDYEVTGSAVSSISTGNILNGDEDGWYTVIVRLVAVTGSSTPFLQFNGSGGTAYGRRGIAADGTSVADWAYGGGEAGIYAGYAQAGESGFSVMRVYAKTGAVRLVNAVRYGRLTGTSPNSSVTVHSGVWNDTSTNIISMTLLDTGGPYMNVGTRVIILKSNNFTSGTPTGIITTPYIKGAWVRLPGSGVLGSPASSVTFSGLDGDRDVLYYLSTIIKGGSTGTYNRVAVRPNNVSSTSSYGSQHINAQSTTITADRYNTAETAMWMGYVDSSSQCSMANMLMFAKKGFVRPAICIYAGNVSGTTVNHITQISWSFNDTTNNITSLVLPRYYDMDYGTGSTFELYALRPNG